MVTAPQILGYRDLTLISATGGQAYVYRARKATMDGSAVAIKVYRRELEDADRRRFLREVQALQALQGRSHVVRLLEADFTADGPGYVVMDLYAGSVADRLAVERTLPVGDALRIGAQVAEALTHTHEATARILHRDIKPGNILLTRDGAAVLSDFGISAIYRDDGRFTATARIGTVGYTAPEVHAGESESVASDIYSLGATLHTMLTGAPPAAVPGRAAPDGTLHAVPEPVAAVLRRALSPDPADRQASARLLREDLLRASTTAAPPPPAKTRLSPPPGETRPSPPGGSRPAPPPGGDRTAPPGATRVLPGVTARKPLDAVVRPRLLDPPVADPDLGRTISVSLLAVLAGLGALTLLDWPWWCAALIVTVPVAAGAVLHRALRTTRLFGPAAAATLACYAVPGLICVSRFGDDPFRSLVLAALTLTAFGGQLVATHELERYARHRLASTATERANRERELLFEAFRDRYWLDGADPPEWLDDVLGPLPAARAMPWRDGGGLRFAVVCDRSVVLVAVLDGARPGRYELNPANGHACRVFADGRPNTWVDTRLKALAGRAEAAGWGTAGVSTGCVAVLTTDGARSDGIRLAPAALESTSLTVVVAADTGQAVVRLLAGADPLVIDPVLLRMVRERAERPGTRPV